MIRSLILVMLLITSPALACGVERWPVKTGADQDAENVDLTVQPADIATLIALPAPPNPDVQENTRYAPTELTTFQISGTLTVIKKEKDEDYHLVISDDQGRTMIVESPAPHCAHGRFAQHIQTVRDTIDAQFPVFKNSPRLPDVAEEMDTDDEDEEAILKLHPNIPVTVIGVAFFDVLHGQEGVAPNGIELHPILSISFNAEVTN
jgi:hypothetical protein